MSTNNSDYDKYYVRSSPSYLHDIENPQDKYKHDDDDDDDVDDLQVSLLQPSTEVEDSEGAANSENIVASDRIETFSVLTTQDAEIQHDKIPCEPHKTFLSAIFLGTGFLATTTSLATVHERVPDTHALPDVVLDNIKYRRWGLDVSEYFLMISTLSAIVLVMVHSHRLVIFRRVMFLLGILYYYRAFTMFVTVLPKPDETYACMPKKNDTTTLDYVKRVLAIMSGGGLSINGKHVYCGDYIFSGHTVTLTMGYLIIKQYSPCHFKMLHWASFLLSLSGVIFLLLARGHYTIDVMLAYYVTSRIWWMYHTLAHSQVLRSKGEHNLMDNVWWWHVLRYFEAQVKGPLPRTYSLPVPGFVKHHVCQIIDRVHRKKSDFLEV